MRSWGVCERCRQEAEVRPVFVYPVGSDRDSENVCFVCEPEMDAA